MSEDELFGVDELVVGNQFGEIRFLKKVDL